MATMNRRSKLIEFYGGEEAYKAEMLRRGDLRKIKRGGFNDPETARSAQLLSTQAKKEKKLMEQAHARSET